MRRGPRGGPGRFDARLARTQQHLAAGAGAARDPLSVLATVLRHQLTRAENLPSPVESPAEGFPRLDLAKATPVIVEELVAAVHALQPEVPTPLAEAGQRLQQLTPGEAAAVVETWLDDTTLVEPRLGFWLQVAAAPVLEIAARAVALPDDWRGAACPVCGGLPRASAIAEESGEFMAGSPRSLVCGRCATWWPFARITCAACGEEDSRQISAYLAEPQSWARVDTCATCHSYVKTFDLRQPGAIDVIPLVDDVATLTLDLWAIDRGFSRPTPSLAGV